MMGAFVHSGLAQALGRALIHSLWEGAIAAIALSAALWLTRSPRARYVSACSAMLAVMATFALTFWRMATQTTTRAGLPVLPPAHAGGGAGNLLQLNLDTYDRLAWLAPAWIGGVVLFHLYRLAGYLAARRLRTCGVCSAPETWRHRLRALAERLGVSAPVVLLESCFTTTPVVMGVLRPVILVPLGMLVNMPAGEIEAILLHELAHIRRRDYLVNVLQMIAEGFLFYHPAVWWISHVIREEREHCCDDLAVAAGANALQYASALMSLEENRRPALHAALAADGGSLMKRIRRILYPRETRRVAFPPILSACVLAVAAVMAVAAWQPQPQTETAYDKWVKEDVVYIISNEERAAFNRLTTDEERAEFIAQFWLRRDPTPGTVRNEFKEEHYRRIGYTNERYGTANLPGWKSDRGMIYISYGPPDEIESHPTQGKEQWLYHHLDGVGDNIIIEFSDPSGNGEYRLAAARR